MTADLPNEGTSRTAPELRDLIVALGAGTAGAYATVRRDVSSSLPGVAVAVALVPPLGVVGIALEAGNMTFARGAMLLYTTNLAAIIFAGVVVFAATGFVPPKRLAMTFRRSALVGLLVGGVVLAIAVPLVRASRTAVEESERQIDAEAIVDDWLGNVDTSGAPGVDFVDGRIVVSVRAFDEAPDARPLIDDLHNRFGDDVPVDVEWESITRVEATTTPPTSLPSVEEVRRNQIEAMVVRLFEVERDPPAQVEAVTVDGGFVRIDASGVGSAPSSAEIATFLSDELDEQVEVQIAWIEREIAVDELPPTPDELLQQRVTDAAAVFAAEEELRVLSVEVIAGNATVELAGLEEPDAAPLREELEQLVGEDGSVTILFVEQRDITTTTTTPTTAPTTTAPAISGTWAYEETFDGDPASPSQDLHPADLVTHRFELDRVGEAYSQMAAGRCGKVAVCFDEELELA